MEDDYRAGCGMGTGRIPRERHQIKILAVAKSDVQVCNSLPYFQPIAEKYGQVSAAYPGTNRKNERISDTPDSQCHDDAVYIGRGKGSIDHGHILPHTERIRRAGVFPVTGF